MLWPTSLRLLAIGSLLFATAAHCADIKIVGGLQSTSAFPGECSIEFRGDIEPGDSDNLLVAISKMNQRINDETINVCLHSNGGSTDESIKIIFYLLSRGTQVRTIVGPNSKCLSACALIFMAGMGCAGSTCMPARFIHVSGQVGFHAPFLEPLGKNLPVDISEIVKSHETATRQLAQLARLFSRRRLTGGDRSGSSWLDLAVFAELLEREKDSFFYIDSVGRAGYLDVQVFGAGENSGELSGINRYMRYHACTNILNWSNGEIGDEKIIKPDALVALVKGTKEKISKSKVGYTAELSQDLPLDWGLWRRCLVKTYKHGGTSIQVFESRRLTQIWRYSAPIWIFLPSNFPIRMIPNFLAGDRFRKSDAAH